MNQLLPSIFTRRRDRDSTVGPGRVLLASTAFLLVASSALIHAATNEEQGSSAAEKAAPALTADQSATLARVFAAWQKRQEHVKSFHVVWDTRVTWPKGYGFRSHPHFTTPAELWVGNVPIVVENETQFTMPQTEWWGQEGDHFRFDHPIFEYDAAGADRWKQVARVRLIRDRSLRSRLTIPSSQESKPWVAICRIPAKTSPFISFAEPSLSNWSGEGDLLPLSVGLRPLSPASGWSPQSCRIESEDDIVGDVHCIKITKGKGDDSATRWIDPKRDYVVVLEARPFNFQMVIDYQRDPQHGWIPSRWTWTLPGETSRPRATAAKEPASERVASGPATFQATVTRYAINEKFDTDPFATTAPSNAEVYDATDGGLMSSKGQEHSIPPQKARAILDRIAASWLKRQTQIRSFQFTWRREWRVGRSGQSWALERPLDRVCTACGEGSLFALEMRTPGWSPSPHVLFKDFGWSHRGKTAFDGVATGSFGMGGGFKKSGFDAGNLSETDADCFWLAFLPPDVRFTGLDLTKLQVLANDARIGDTPCILVETGAPGQSHTFLWLDPARENIVLRKQWLPNGWNAERDDFSYRARPDMGWIPTCWKKTVVTADGTIFVSSTDTVIESSINQPIPHAEFKVELPTSEYVEDKDSEIDREKRTREAAAAVLVERWGKPLAKKPKTQSAPDPQFDARSDVDSALKTARATGKRVLIEFGGQGYPDCGKLYNALREHAELSARLRNGFVLVLVDTDYLDAGQMVYEQYVPQTSRKDLPALCVLNPDGTVRHNGDTADLKTGDDYDVDKLKAFLEKWSGRD